MNYTIIKLVSSSFILKGILLLSYLQTVLLPKMSLCTMSDCGSLTELSSTSLLAVLHFTDRSPKALILSIVGYLHCSDVLFIAVYCSAVNAIQCSVVQCSVVF